MRSVLLRVLPIALLVGTAVAAAPPDKVSPGAPNAHASPEVMANQPANNPQIKRIEDQKKTLVEATKSPAMQKLDADEDSEMAALADKEKTEIDKVRDQFKSEREQVRDKFNQRRKELAA